MRISIGGADYDVRFQRVVDEERYGYYRNGQPKIRALCSISRVTGEKGKAGYIPVIGAGVFDTQKSNKPHARKKSFAKALLKLRTHFQNLGYTIGRNERKDCWETYFATFLPSVEQFAASLRVQYK